MFKENYHYISNYLKTHWNWNYFFSTINFISTTSLVLLNLKGNSIITKEIEVIKEKIVKVPVEIIKEVRTKPQRRSPVKNPKSIKGFTISAELYNKVITYLDSQTEITSIPFFIQNLLENYNYLKKDNLIIEENIKVENNNEKENSK